MTVTSRLLRVAVPVPLVDTFDYVWTEPGPVPPLGSRVRVPFGRREQIGIVVAHPTSSALPEAKLKAARARLDAVPLLSAELLETLCWAADYYHYPLGEVLSHALPARLRSGAALDEPRPPSWRLTAAGRALVADAAAPPRALRQREALQTLAATPLTTADCRARGISPERLRRLAAKGLIEAVVIGIDTPGEPTAIPAPISDASRPMLTEDQARTLAAVRAETDLGFRAYLLQGVTGSGKTEIYLRLVADQLALGRQTLLLVPEIGLTPQLVARLAQRFGTELALMHSGLTERERLTAWRAAHEQRAKLVVGTRSAVFAPLPRAGLVIVDEEHDASYKQQTGFRYSARDLAVLRARRLGVPVLLGSATPSLESYANAESGRYRRLLMPRRIGSAGQPELRVIDMGRHASRQALSTPLVTAIERHLGAGSQILLFLNRRGFAPALFCPTCKQAETCARCDARLTVHARAGKLRCHHCGHERALRWRCDGCGAERIAVGAGTQRVGDELAALFPQARTARLDRDATSRKGALEAVLGAVEAGEVDILIGTQMLTKGHDFPRVTLVGVLNADQGLFGSDPRSHERLAQTLLQVAGRAGRADLPGEVLVQTHFPGHPLLVTLLGQDYGAFASLALAERRATDWPPAVHLAAWHAEAPHREHVFAFLEKVRQESVRAAADLRPNAVTLLGPAPASMERKDGRFRAQLLVQSRARRPLHAVLGTTLDAVRATREARRVRWSLDVDPLEV